MGIKDQASKLPKSKYKLEDRPSHGPNDDDRPGGGGGGGSGDGMDGFERDPTKPDRGR